MVLAVLLVGEDNNHRKGFHRDHKDRIGHRRDRVAHRMDRMGCRMDRIVEYHHRVWASVGLAWVLA